MQRANAGGSDAEKQQPAEDKPEGRWLVVTTDSVVSFFDYLVPHSSRAQFALVRRFVTSQTRVVPQSQAVRHVSLAALDGKAALTVDFFPRSSVIAFACADGQVRLWDCARWARTLTLTSTSSKPIVAIFARLVHHLSPCRTRTHRTHRTRAPHTLAKQTHTGLGCE